ncbi:MAG TPA: hypothetical protein VEW69_06390 [Alphaproteobacteria bacterium]|nr:hypothetical protein [Alphaproteobacteria bacterium]
MFGDLSQETLDLLKKADVSALNKAATINTGTGLNAYDLRGPALQLYPVITPLRNRLPRQLSNSGDTATRWKAITAVSPNFELGVAAGQRSGAMQVTEQDYTAPYAGIGLEGSIDWEAVWAGGVEFDNKATIVQSLLRAVMIGEENVILNGDASMPLSSPPATSPGPVPAPTTSTVPSSSGGTLPANVVVFVVALTARGLANSTVSLSGVPFVTTPRTNMDGSTTQYAGGASAISAGSTPITPGTSTVQATVPAVRGAAGYAWYVGTALANATLTAITTVNKVILSAAASGTQLANAPGSTTDNTTNSLVFDGFLTQALKSPASYFASLDGNTLTADQANGIVEIDAALQWFWDNKRLSPTEIWVNSQEARNINKKIVASGGVPLFRFTLPGGAGSDDQKPALLGGASLAKYWNKFTQQFLDIRIHPNLAPGTMFFNSTEIPYPLSGVDNVSFIRCRRDYYQIEWPVVSRQYVYGVYADEVLVCRAPFALGVLANIANG